MKLYPVALLALLAPAMVMAGCDGEEEDVCIAEGLSCGGDEMGCCDGLACFGFYFFKTCQAPPSCLREWYDCSSGMDCCGDLVCAIDGDKRECQKRTLDTCTEEPCDSTPEDDVPDIPNMNVLGPSNLEIAGVYGDPHM